MLKKCNRIITKWIQTVCEMMSFVKIILKNDFSVEKNGFSVKSIEICRNMS